ncbi:hypothetical protein SFC65_19345 [Priestia filamentosa]|uniref:hypothetical protein n=1 Tax=Priestia filamentosa TaxID=1402861 RepID=UPI0039822E15
MNNIEFENVTLTQQNQQYTGGFIPTDRYEVEVAKGYIIKLTNALYIEGIEHQVKYLYVEVCKLKNTVTVIAETDKNVDLNPTLYILSNAEKIFDINRLVENCKENEASLGDLTEEYIEAFQEPLKFHKKHLMNV